MDILTRNRIFLENEELISRILRQNRPAIRLVRMEPEDVYQELAIAALQAIDSFDPLGINSMEAHIWLALQCELAALQSHSRPRKVVHYVTTVTY